MERLIGSSCPGQNFSLAMLIVPTRSLVFLENFAKYSADRKKRNDNLEEQLLFLRSLGSNSSNLVDNQFTTPPLKTLDNLVEKFPEVRNQIEGVRDYIGRMDETVQKLKFELDVERGTTDMLR
jgi:hypothetical protein